MSSGGNDAAYAAASIFNVNGLVALVTGGGSGAYPLDLLYQSISFLQSHNHMLTDNPLAGIGLMMAKALAQNGAAKVYIAGRRLEILKSAASSIGPNVIPIQCDVTSTSSLQAAASLVEQDSGHLNLLVCNSGIGGPQVKPVKPETTLDEWVDQNLANDYGAFVNTFAVNAAAVWYTTMTFLKLLDRGNKKGNVSQTSQVVVTSSIGAFNKKAPGGWAYGQSKAAATHAVKQLSVTLPQWNIR
jgi:NAD(P)-dependent dehydrogenase (short-subunit alcohol dehydrogenase family)